MTTQTESKSIAIQRAMIADLRRECADAKKTCTELTAVIAAITHGRTVVVWDDEIQQLIDAGTTLEIEPNGGGGWIVRIKKGTANDRR